MILPLSVTSVHIYPIDVTSLNVDVTIINLVKVIVGIWLRVSFHITSLA